MKREQIEKQRLALVKERIRELVNHQLEGARGGGDSDTTKPGSTLPVCDCNDVG